MAARKALRTGITPGATESAGRSLNAAMLHRVAGQAGRELPAATIRQDAGKVVLVNIKIREVSAVAIAQTAKDRGITQKQPRYRPLGSSFTRSILRIGRRRGGPHDGQP